MTKKEKLLDISMLIGAAIAIITAIYAGFIRECDELRENTFRLHILANSDSLYDQRVKYALRDHLTEELGEIFLSCETKEQSKAAAERNLTYIEQRANEFLQSRGCGYEAVCSVERIDFPTRMYGEVTLPAGTYDALEITLGEGGGKNWWCVLYPSICIGAASPDKTFVLNPLYEQMKRSDRLTSDALAEKRGKIEVKFAFYEIFERFLEILGD